MHAVHEERHEALQVSVNVNENTACGQGQEECSRKHDRERETERESGEEDFPGVQVLRAEIIVRYTEGQCRQQGKQVSQDKNDCEGRITIEHFLSRETMDDKDHYDAARESAAHDGD